MRSWPSELEGKYYADPRIRDEEMPWTRDPGVIPGAETYVSEGPDATTIHLDEFFEAVRKGTPTKEDAAVGHHAASCAHMVNLSMDRGKIVHWDRGRDSIRAQ